MTNLPSTSWQGTNNAKLTINEISQNEPWTYSKEITTNMPNQGNQIPTEHEGHIHWVDRWVNGDIETTILNRNETLTRDQKTAREIENLNREIRNQAQIIKRLKESSQEAYDMLQTNCEIIHCHKKSRKESGHCMWCKRPNIADPKYLLERKTRIAKKTNL